MLPVYYVSYSPLSSCVSAQPFPAAAIDISFMKSVRMPLITVGPRSHCLSQSPLISPCSLILPPPTERLSAFAPFFFFLFFCNLKQAGVKGCDVSHLLPRTPHRVALIRLPTGVLIVRFSVLSFALTHFVPEAGYKWEIASGAVISR